jgi:AGZA family xanthine/uracil permease-like MFS transporter
MGTYAGQEVNYKTEIIAGMTTFLTMSYIIFINPDILAKTGMDRGALIVVTALVSGIITIITGIFTNTPFAMAPGMGLNAFFTFVLVMGQKIRWETALGIVFISGFVFFILTLTGFRSKIVEAIPKDLIMAITVGIGIFISFIGLQNIGLIVKDSQTFVKVGPFTSEVIIGLLGFLIIIILEIRKIKGSLLFGILITTFISLLLRYGNLPKSIMSFNIDISKIFLKVDILGALKIGFIAPIFSLMFVDLFDSVGSIIGLSRSANFIKDDGSIPKLSKLLGIDAIATMIGALFGTSTTTTYIESAAGISSGGKSGLTSIVTGLMFIMAIFFVPLIIIVPPYATAPALIMVGYAMIKNIGEINFKDIRVGLPSFIILIMIALSYSISTGLAFGFLLYTLIKLIKLEFKDISGTLWVINLLCMCFFVFN